MFLKKDRAVLSPTEAAEAFAADALGLFTQATVGLENAVAAHKDIIDDADATIGRATFRRAASQTALNTYVGTISRINEIVGV